MTLNAPFPWPGGKRRVASVVWRALGPKVANYIEPFFGSGAVMLGRPGGAGKIETANDISGAVVNFWRAVTYAPDDVARHCDWPVSELDMHARHTWLVERLGALRDQLRADPMFCDTQVAGWWVWGICQWIGTGWCAEPNNHKRPILDGIGKGINGATWQQRPHASGANAGMGVHRLPQQMPKITVSDNAAGTGGIFRANLPALGNDRGINGVAAPPSLDWFRALQTRLRRVRWVCGDWRRVLGPSVMGKGANVGGRRPCAIFFDAPYDPKLRSARTYADDEPGTSVAVREWCLEHGDDPELRIALCGYLEEHDNHMPHTWARHRWTGARGYAGEGNDNRTKETIWFSPHCLPLDEQRGLFSSEAP